MWINLKDQEISKESQQVAEKFSQIFACFRLLMDNRERHSSCLIEDRTRQIRDNTFGGETKNLEHFLLSDRISTKCHQLVEHRLRVSQASFSSNGDSRGSILGEVYPFFRGDVGQMFPDCQGRNSS